MAKTQLLTPMFWLLLDSTGKVSRLPLLLQSPSPASRLMVDKRLGGDIGRTDVPSWWRAYSIPYDPVLISKSLRKEGEGGDIWVLWHLSCQATVNYHYLNPQVFLPSFYFLPVPQERGVSERLGECLAVGQSQPIFHFRVCNNRWTLSFLMSQTQVTY